MHSQGALLLNLFKQNQYDGAILTPDSKYERFDVQSRDGAEVLDVGSEHPELVLDGGGGDERIAHLQPMAEGERFHQLGSASRDGLGDGQQSGRALLKHLLYGQQFGHVAHTLQHFEIAHCRQRECAEFIEPACGLRVAAQMPDQHIGIDQDPQGSLRVPLRL